jgi:hypothetical protein
MNVFSKWIAGVLVGVGSLLAFALTAIAQPSPSPTIIRAKAEDVFKRPEFRPHSASKSWLNRQIVSFFEWLDGLRSVSPVLFWLVRSSCLLFVLVLAALFVFLIVRVIRRVRSTVDSEKDRKLVAASAKRAWLSANYRTEAKRLANDGDYTEAIRFLFLALVYRFDERGRVSFHMEYTNREYLELLSDRRKVRDAMQLLVDILDEHWYGQRPCQRQQYEDCLAVYERLAA